MDAHSNPITHPNARLGIIGGGQLGRMMVMAAARLGLRAVVLDPDENAPAGQLGMRHIAGDWRDPEKLAELVRASAVSTFDIEDIDTETLLELEAQGHCIHPSPQILTLLQDKLKQKQALAAAGIPTAEFIALDDPEAGDAEVKKWLIFNV